MIREQPEVDRTTNPSASIKDSLRILSPICFYFAVVTPTISANFYFSSRPIYIFSKRNTTVRFVTTVFTFNHFISPTNDQINGRPNRLDTFSRKELLDQQTSYPTKIFCQTEPLLLSTSNTSYHSYHDLHYSII